MIRLTGVATSWHTRTGERVRFAKTSRTLRRCSAVLHHPDRIHQRKRRGDRVHAGPAGTALPRLVHHIRSDTTNPAGVWALISASTRSRNLARCASGPRTRRHAGSPRETGTGRAGATTPSPRHRRCLVVALVPRARQRAAHRVTRRDGGAPEPSSRTPPAWPCRTAASPTAARWRRCGRATGRSPTGTRGRRARRHRRTTSSPSR